ncbi:MAG: DUF4492 domain-containing protein [Bacteroidetes bacterium 4572_128]|nr:MAG: DUF4492 domain-containing protein [Bacteroidetes bacterium 4572_128]
MKKIFNFYYDGFTNMKLGKVLWLLIFIKLFVMFAILKTFFFKDFLSEKFNTDKEKSEYILKELTKF